jgi:hypothetical protein
VSQISNFGGIDLRMLFMPIYIWDIANCLIKTIYFIKLDFNL